MDATAVALVAGFVVGIVQVLKLSGAVAPRFAVFVSALLSAIGVWVWAYAHGPFVRASAFDYLAGWGVSFTSAAGAFGIGKGAGDTARAAKEMGAAVKDAAVSVTQSMTGTGKG